jgi:predicted MFS family arabinose efflux permease
MMTDMNKNRRTFDDKLSTTFLISTVYPLGPAAIILMPMLVGGVIDDFGFSEQQAGYIAALESMGLVVASLVAALWIRKISWTTMLFIGFASTALLNIVSANLSDFVPLLITRFAAGVTGGTVFALTVAALGDNKQPDQAFGIAQVVQGAMMFGAFAAAPAILQHWTVSGLYYMLAVVSILMIASLWRYPSAGASREVDTGNGGEGESYTGLIWIGLIASFLFFSNIFGFWTYIERVGQAAGLSTETIGWALGLSQFAAIIGAGAAAFAADRFGRTLPLLLALVGITTTLWLLVGQFGSIVYYIGAGLFQALFVMANSYQLGVIAKIDIKGHFLVLVTGFQGLGAAVGPAVAASLINNGDYSRINLVAALSCVISIAMFLYIIYRTRHMGNSLAAGQVETNS